MIKIGYDQQDIDKHEFNNRLKSTKMVRIRFRQKWNRSLQNSKNKPKSIKYQNKLTKNRPELSKIE